MCEIRIAAMSYSDLKLLDRDGIDWCGRQSVATPNGCAAFICDTAPSCSLFQWTTSDDDDCTIHRINFYVCTFGRTKPKWLILSK